ncbi:MAG TPA: hypothetical protein VHR43_04530 [Gemmatimonadales bacterium]|jgi:hypothetical protein|nr:hypothetical protein [Gemmatimonadales bacterium]
MPTGPKGLLWLALAAAAVSCKTGEERAPMSDLPRSDRTLVIRTDFSDDRAWDEVRTALVTPVDGFLANVEFVDQRRLDGLTVERLLALSPPSANRAIVFLVDQEALRRPDRPLLVVDLLGDHRGRTFRVVPAEAWGVENNLSLANMDWEEFADHVDPDGVFRGFPR